MKKAAMMLMVCVCAVTNLYGDNMKKIENAVLPAVWKLFRCNDLTNQDAVSARFEDDILVTFSSRKKVKPVILNHAETMDLALGKKPDRANRAVLVGKIDSKVPQTIYIGFAADWWIDGYCNGQYIGGTDAGGNDNWPPKATDRIFPLNLRAGKNDISFLVKPGSGSWQTAIGFFASCEDPDLPPRVMPDAGIAFHPYLTNPGADSVTISYLLNGRQPLGLEYRPAGTKEWTTVHVLRGGQIIDEIPVLQFNLTGLKPDTDYEYRAIRYLPPHFQKSVKEKTYTFRTYSAKPQKFSFFVIGDTQDTTKRKNLARVTDIQKAFPQLNKCDFFIHVGDLHGVINHFRNDVFDSGLKAIPSSTYILSTRGNHDFEGTEAQQWLAHFNYKNNKSYGMFRIGDVCMIIVDTGHHLPKNSKNPHNIYTKLNRLDTLLEEQKIWLQEIVKTPEYKTAKFRVVFSHVAPHGQNDSFRYMFPRTRDMVKNVFRNSKENIDLWVAGHTHRYKVVKTDKEWGFPVVVVGGGGPNAEKKHGNALLFEVESGKITMKALCKNCSGCETVTFLKIPRTPSSFFKPLLGTEPK